MVMTSRIIAVASSVPFCVILLSQMNPNLISSKIAFGTFALGVLVVAVTMHSHPMVPVQRQAPAPAQTSRRYKIDLNPPMPQRVADEDMPIERVARRREETRRELAEIDRVRAEERARVEAERPALTEDAIEALLTRHYEDVLGTAEGRALWTKLIAEAEAAAG